jgi:branched-subunit amino acid aminotransferase/4-amino-4-deoxychorismate lyase
VTLLAVAVAGRGIVSPSDAVFTADDEALLRGAAAFETIRVRRRAAVLLDRHVARLERSVAALGLPPADDATRLAIQAVAAAGIEEAVLRLFRSESALVATVAPLPADLDTRRARGVALASVRAAPVTLLQGVKATSYAFNLAARAEAERAGADDALLVGPGGEVLETTTANIWWRDGDVLSTPAAEGVLPGVTRGALLELARVEGYRVRQGIFTTGLLAPADEAFTSSAVREVLPVVMLDGHAVGNGRPGEAARRLQAALEAMAA